MRYQISGKQIDIGEALQTHVKTELGEAVKKYAERPTDANVIFSKSAHEFVCEATVHLSTGLTASAKAHATDIYSALVFVNGLLKAPSANSEVTGNIVIRDYQIVAYSNYSVVQFHDAIVNGSSVVVLYNTVVN